MRKMREMLFSTYVIASLRHFSFGVMMYAVARHATPVFCVRRE